MTTTSTPPAEPTSQEEFLRRYLDNEKLEGFGFDTTRCEPCPFCAAPNFLRYRILEVQQKSSHGATCEVCGRSGRYVYSQTEDGALHIEFVQTGGPTAPLWMQYPPRLLTA